MSLISLSKYELNLSMYARIGSIGWKHTEWLFMTMCMSESAPGVILSRICRNELVTINCAAQGDRLRERDEEWGRVGVCFFFQAEDGIRDRDGWLEFRRVLFRSSFLSLVTWWASDSGKDQGVSGNRTPRERMGIEMKSKGPKWVKPLLKTKELESAL